MAEVNAALDACMQDQSIKLLVITGVGEKAFSAGVEVADHTPDKVDQMI
jgi:cyclohexa-1,5-dienecarbonyl-CoA hydratase